MTVQFGAFSFHADRRQILRDGQALHLTPKAFDLLALLIERAPAVVSKIEIHERLWPGTFVSEAALAGLVKELRRVLADDRAGTLIRTAHRVGFAFTAAADTEPPIATGVTHWLVVDSHRIQLRDGATVIGRDPDATVWLDVPGVSRRHAQIVLVNGVAAIEDLGSKNGTLLADRPVRGRVELHNADRIQLARTLLTYYVSGRGVSTATQPGSQPESDRD